MLNNSINTSKKQGLKQLGLGILGTGLIIAANAEELKTPEQESELRDMVVTATKTETPVEEIGYSMSVIDREEIENSNLTYVTDILSTVRGVDFWSNGPHSNANTLSIRGLKGYHTKVLVNGIPAQDTSGVQVLATLNDLTLDNVQRIEVIRGASSTMYGSNAMGGVVNVITRKGEDTAQGSVSTEFGSHEFQKYNANFRGKEGIMDYSFSGSYTGEKGISNKNGLPVNDDDDPFRNENYNANVGFQLLENLHLELFGRFSDIDEEYDNGSSALSIPDSGDIHTQRWMTGGKLSAQNLWDIWDSSFRYSFSRSDRHYLDTTGYSVDDEYEGDTSIAEWRNTLQLNEWNKLTLGYEWDKSEAEIIDGGTETIDETYRTNAYYAQHQMEPVSNLFLTLGARYNDHSEFGEETTYSTSAAYQIEKTDTTLRASFSTGYRAPSLYELFDPTYGNQNLDPETSKTWDLGFEQLILDGVIEFGVTYFDTKVEDFIDYDWSTSSYAQKEGVQTDGLESFIAFHPLQNLSLELTHTYMDTENQQTGDKLIRRPRHKLTADATYTFLEKRATANLQMQHVGKRKFYNGKTGDDYTLANLALSYKLSKNIEIFGRIHNLLDEEYQRVVNYNTYDRTYYGGVKISF